MKSIEDIVQELWRTARQLRQEHLTYYDYIIELSGLLFLKVAPMINMATSLPAYLNWNVLTGKATHEQYEYYQALLTTLGQVNDPYIAGVYSDATTHLKNQTQLAHLITVLEKNLNDLPLESFGEIYESLLERCAREEASSPHIMPPRALIDVMTILTQPEKDECVYDPLAGTASFLTAANQYARVASEELSPPYPAKYPDKTSCLGIEPDLSQQRLALINCLLHRITTIPLPVQWSDSLLTTIPNLSADVILSMLVLPEERKNELPRYDLALTLLQHIYRTLKPYGRAAVIVPDRILQTAGPAQQIRRELLDTCSVHTVLRLPEGIFYPHQIPAHVLFFKRGASHSTNNTQQTWFYDLRSHFPHFGRYLYLTREHLMPFEIAYGDDPFGESPRTDEGVTGRWRCLSRENLAKQEDRLDYCWLQTQKLPSQVHANDIWQVLESTVEELQAIKVILEK